jgi:4-amino-4-deoxy-L-arabinose transferase-like glycosyltransferase
MTERVRSSLWALMSVLAVCLVIRLLLLAGNVFPFDSDEAIIGLMARHILVGERPIFFYGQSYMGSLDAWLVAALFALLGPSVFLIRIVQVLLFLAHVSLTFVLAEGWSGSRRVATLAALLMAIPPVLITLYTTVSLGGYGEVLVLGDLVLLLGWKLAEDRTAHLGWWVGLGVITGVGFWILGLIAVYAIPVAVLLLWRHRMRGWRGYMAGMLGFFLGSGVWWFYNMSQSWSGLRTLFDPVAERSALAPVLPFGMRFLGLLLIGFPGLLGIRLPWLPGGVPVYAIPVVVSVYGVLAWFAIQQARQRRWGGAYRLLWGVVLSLLGLLLLSRFGSDPTGRYLLPLYTPLCIFGAAGLDALGGRWRWASWAGMAVFVVMHLSGTVYAAAGAQGLTAQFDPRLHYGNVYDQELIAFLEEHGGARGYTNYWIAFKLAFLSDERVILDAALPYKASLQVVDPIGRYPGYDNEVARAASVVYVTGNQPELDAVLRERFRESDVAYREHEMGPYRVFYDLSVSVTPAALGMGQSY